MKSEIECRLLEVNVKEFIQKLQTDDEEISYIAAEDIFFKILN